MWCYVMKMTTIFYLILDCMILAAIYFGTRFHINRITTVIEIAVIASVFMIIYLIENILELSNEIKGSKKQD